MSIVIAFFACFVPVQFNGYAKASQINFLTLTAIEIAQKMSIKCRNINIMDASAEFFGRDDQTLTPIIESNTCDVRVCVCVCVCVCTYMHTCMCVCVYLYFTVC